MSCGCRKASSVPTALSQEELTARAERVDAIRAARAAKLFQREERVRLRKQRLQERRAS